MTKLNFTLTAIVVLATAGCGKLSALESIDNLAANPPLRAEYLKQCKATISTMETQARCMYGVQAEWRAQKAALLEKLGQESIPPEMLHDMKTTFINSMTQAGIDTTGINALLD